jgi:hypothetical protein
VTALVDVDRLRDTLALDPDLVPDEVLRDVVDAVAGALLPRLSERVDLLDPPAAVREAALGMCVQVWQSRFAPGGQMMGGDLGIITSPHLLGPGLVARFGGLLAPYLRHGGAVIA